jgi:hypothetical protein
MGEAAPLLPVIQAAEGAAEGAATDWFGLVQRLWNWTPANFILKQAASAVASQVAQQVLNGGTASSAQVQGLSTQLGGVMSYLQNTIEPQLLQDIEGGINATSMAQRAGDMIAYLLGAVPVPVLSAPGFMLLFTNWFGVNQQSHPEDDAWWPSIVSAQIRIDSDASTLADLESNVPQLTWQAPEDESNPYSWAFVGTPPQGTAGYKVLFSPWSSGVWRFMQDFEANYQYVPSSGPPLRSVLGDLVFFLTNTIWQPQPGQRP